jgi:hypothetical protein
MTPTTTVVASGDVVVTLAPAAVEPMLVFEAILTAQPERAAPRKIEVRKARNPRTRVRLARRSALG